MFTGAILACEVHVPRVVAASLAQRGTPIPPPQTGWALIDTGAGLTAVDENAVTQLGISPVGVANMGTAGGQVQRPTYPVRLVFPELIGWDFDVTTPIASVDLTGQTVTVAAGQAPQQVLVLLGRDVLRSCVLVWHGPFATWSLSY